LYCFSRRLCIIVCRSFFRLRTWGQENVPLVGAGILASNHQCYLDPPLAACLIRRQCSFLARSSLFAFAPFRWLLARLGAVPLGRGESDAAGLRRAVELLRSGKLLLLFPEGTRTRDGALGRVQSGVAGIALRAGVAVVPTFIHGAFDCWPRTRKLPRPGRVGVFYGRPIAAPAAADGGHKEQVRELTAMIQSALEDLQHRAFEAMPLKHRSAPSAARAGAGQDGPVPVDPPASADERERAARPAPEAGHRCECGASGPGSSGASPGALNDG
jgi:1-acyl-sn-glycerol-3-phosphate acyltransferase